MLINSLQLDKNIDSANIFTLFGSEKLLLQQSSDKILLNLKNQGFENKLVFDADAKFNFGELKNELVAQDLFIENKIIQLNITSLLVKITKELELLFTNIGENIKVLITLPKLTPAQQKSKWFLALKNTSLMVQHFDIYPNKMQSWVVYQMQDIGLAKNIEVAKIIAENNESNLLGAFNEIQKLNFVYGNNQIDTAEFSKQNNQQSIYSIYSLIDNAMLGKYSEVIKIYQNLKIDNLHLASLLTIQIKQIIDIHLKIKQKIGMAKAMQEAGVWSSKTALVNSALNRHSYPLLQKMLLKLGRVDRSIKGLDNKNIEQELLTILLNLAGVKNGLN